MSTQALFPLLKSVFSAPIIESWCQVRASNQIKQFEIVGSFFDEDTSFYWLFSSSYFIYNLERKTSVQNLPPDEKVLFDPYGNLKSTLYQEVGGRIEFTGLFYEMAPFQNRFAQLIHRDTGNLLLHAQIHKDHLTYRYPSNTFCQPTGESGFLHEGPMGQDALLEPYFDAIETALYCHPQRYLEEKINEARSNPHAQRERHLSYWLEKLTEAPIKNGPQDFSPRPVEGGYVVSPQEQIYPVLRPKKT